MHARVASSAAVPNLILRPRKRRRTAGTPSLGAYTSDIMTHHHQRDQNSNTPAGNKLLQNERQSLSFCASIPTLPRAWIGGAQPLHEQSILQVANILGSFWRTNAQSQASSYVTLKSRPRNTPPALAVGATPSEHVRT